MVLQVHQVVNGESTALKSKLIRSRFQTLDKGCFSSSKHANTHGNYTVSDGKITDDELKGVLKEMVVA
jgi:hypothetical protein